MKLVFCITYLFLFSFQNFFSQEIEYRHDVHYSFIENKGQWDDEVLFQSKFNGGNLWIEQHRFLYQLMDFSQMHEAHANSSNKIEDQGMTQSLVYMNFNGSNEITKIQKNHQSKNYYNYFLGDDQSRWVSQVHGYGEALFSDLYDGIDLKIIEEKAELKYEFIVHPNSNVATIQISYSGQERIEVDNKGNLKIYTPIGQIIEQKPYAYQIINGKILEIQCRYELKENVLSYDVGDYNLNYPLVIDPVLVFATYSGSPSDNFGMTATYGHDGSAYSGGTVFGNSYPTPAVTWETSANFTQINPTSLSALRYGVTDVFLSKYTADGTEMLWTCFLGGGNDTIGTETVHSLITDANDNVYLFGATSSQDFPIQGGFQSVHGGGEDSAFFYNNSVYYHQYGTDIYVAKVSSDGTSLMGSTYVGGSENDGINYVRSLSPPYLPIYDSLVKNYGDNFRGEIMIDDQGNCLVASCTRSTNFPTMNAIQPSLQGQQDGVLFKLNSNLSSMFWSTYYGGDLNDACYSVKIDSSNNVVIAGGTSSENLLGMTGGWKDVFQGGKADGFALKLSGDGQTILGATYIGATFYDQTFFVDIDAEDNIYVYGQSEGALFPVINSAYSIQNSSQYIAKLLPDLSGVISSTVFGNGSSNINLSPSAFLVDVCGNIYVSGWGGNILTGPALTGMPITSDPFQSTTTGFDFYLLVLKRDFSNILYASYIGGNESQEHVDGGTSRFDYEGVVYQSVCGGCEDNEDFPTSPGAHSSENPSSNCNNLVFKFDFQLIPKAEFILDNNIGCAPFTVTFNNLSPLPDSYLWDFGNGNTTSETFEPTVTFDAPGVYEVYLTVTDSICLITDTAHITITVLPELVISTTPDVYSCIPSEVNLTAFSNGQGTQFIWSEDPLFSDTLNSDLSDSLLVITPPNSTVYYVLVENEYCSVMDSVIVNYTSSVLMLSINDSICKGDQTTAFVTNLNPNISFEYTWSPESIIVGSSVNSSVTITPEISQYLYLNAEASNGCSLDDSIYIHVGDVPANLVNATASEYIVPEGGEVTLFGEPDGFSYQWIFPETVDAPNSQSTTATLDQSTLFTFLVTDGICTRSDTVFVTAFPYLCEDPFVFVPNAFTPNFDGENDILFVQGAMIEKMLLRIFDRWGELVFESESRHFGWDGTYKGKPLDPDVYDYYLEVDCIGGQNSIIKGNITLMK